MTGVDYNHEDLRNQMWVNSGEIPGDGIDNDGNGYVDDVYGYDFHNNNGDPMDSNGHGTHCAGTIGAEAGNSIGVAGVSWKPQIMALKFLGASGGSTADAIRALDYAVMMGAQISSNSWGGGGYSQALVDAIDAAAEANHLFIVAAGNDGRDNEITPTYPCSYDRPNMICVASTDSANDISSFSNWGTTVVHIAAPGSRIYSTYPNNQYEFLSGTSMATPHVSGVAALVLDYVDTLTYCRASEPDLDVCCQVCQVRFSGVHGCFAKCPCCSPDGWAVCLGSCDRPRRVRKHHCACWRFCRDHPGAGQRPDGGRRIPGGF